MKYYLICFSTFLGFIDLGDCWPLDGLTDGICLLRRLRFVAFETIFITIGLADLSGSTESVSMFDVYL